VLGRVTNPALVRRPGWRVRLGSQKSGVAYRAANEKWRTTRLRRVGAKSLADTACAECPLWVISGHVQCKTAGPLSPNSGHYLADLQLTLVFGVVAHSGKCPWDTTLFRTFQKLVDRCRKSRKGLSPDDALAGNLLRCRLRDNERRRAGDPELRGLGGVVFD
jgi:hypothetical protein